MILDVTPVDAGIFAVLLTSLVTPVAAYVARNLGIAAHPNPDVPTHERAVPLLGGIGILAGVLPILAYSAIINVRLLGAALGVLVVAALGLYKDVIGRPVSPAGQIIVQSVAGILVALWLPFDFAANPVVDAGTSILLCVLLINAWNFVDVSDGLATSISAICATILAACLWHVGDSAAVIVAAAVVGGSLGFFLHNRPPAQVFMGDVGSFPLGLLIAVLVLALARSSRSPFPGVITAAVPLMDVCATVFLRLRRHKSPFHGGREHPSLLLLARGWNPWQVIAGACITSAAVGSIGYFLTIRN